jgi:hypothetical protein
MSCDQVTYSVAGVSGVVTVALEDTLLISRTEGRQAAEVPDGRRQNGGSWRQE